MHITIDTSAVLSVCINEPSKEKLVELTTGASLVAPASVHWEIGNALSAMVKRARITSEQASACVSVYQKIPIRLVDVNLVNALQIAARFNIYAYDAYLLVCAMQYKTPLLTLDRALQVHANDLDIEILGG